MFDDCSSSCCSYFCFSRGYTEKTQYTGVYLLLNDHLNKTPKSWKRSPTYRKLHIHKWTSNKQKPLWNNEKKACAIRTEGWTVVSDLTWCHFRNQQQTVIIYIRTMENVFSTISNFDIVSWKQEIFFLQILDTCDIICQSFWNQCWTLFYCSITDKTVLGRPWVTQCLSCKTGTACHARWPGFIPDFFFNGIRVTHFVSFLCCVLIL